MAGSAITFKWDSDGRLIEKDINRVPQTFAYDSIGRINSITNTLGTFGYSYASAVSPLVTAIALPNGLQTAIAYDQSSGDARVQSITHSDQNGNTLLGFAMGYNSAGRVQSVQAQLGTSAPTATQYSYDPAGQLVQALIANTATGQNVRSYAYRYDAAGNRIDQTVDNTVSSGNYNRLNQLMNQTGGGVLPLQRRHCSRCALFVTRPRRGSIIAKTKESV